MTVVTQHPWQNGPKELIEYALQHLHKKTDFDQRIAFLLLDVGVETLFKTFLTLPDGVTDAETKFFDRKKAAEGGFHELVNGVKAAAPSRLQGCNLSHVQFYHDLRNKLYHQGNGITVPTEKAKGYAELAVHLLKALLDVDLTEVLRKPELEKALKQQADEVHNALDQIRSEMRLVMEKIEPKLVLPSVVRQIQQLMADIAMSLREKEEVFAEIVETNVSDFQRRCGLLDVGYGYAAMWKEPGGFCQHFRRVLQDDLTPIYLLLFEDFVPYEEPPLSYMYVDAKTYVQTLRDDDTQAIETGKGLVLRLTEMQGVIQNWLKVS